MSAAVLQSDAFVIGSVCESGLLERVRVGGGVRASFVADDTGVSRVHTLSERDGYRLRFPLATDGMQGVIINTGGGVASGDCVELGIKAEHGADVLITTQSAERIYRAFAGTDARIGVSLSAQGGARLVWMPQETILYNGARLTRRLSAEIAADARLLVLEPLVFGRKAHGEIVRDGRLSDQWRIRRDGRLVLAENLLLDGPIASTLERVGVANGAHVSATLLYVAPDAVDRLDATRAHFGGAGFDVAASAWNGMLVVRGVALEVAPLKIAFAGLVSLLTGRAVPRLWQSC